MSNGHRMVAVLTELSRPVWVASRRLAGSAARAVIRSCGLDFTFDFPELTDSDVYPPSMLRAAGLASSDRDGNDIDAATNARSRLDDANAWRGHG